MLGDFNDIKDNNERKEELKGHKHLSLFLEL